MSMNLPVALVSFFLPLAAVAAPGPGFVKAADCVGRFESWATETKTSMATEHKMAAELKLDARPIAEATMPVDGVLSVAQKLCARLELQKVKALTDQTPKPARCADAFTRWEDEMDQAYAMALFERKMDIADKSFVPAQEIARREAKLGKTLCGLLGKLH